MRPDEWEQIRQIDLPYVLVGWHNSSFAAPSLLRRFFPSNKIDCLISASKAAAWEVEFFASFGIHSIRGSTTRRSIQALREMYQSIDQNRIVLLSPDGPSGPLYSVQPGAIALARKRRIPLVFFTIHASPAYRINSWDRHPFPFPFAKVELRLGAILPDDPIWEEDEASICERLRRDLLEITQEPFHGATS